MTNIEINNLLEKFEKRTGRNSLIPEFCDSKGAHYHTGLSRSHLYLLANEGKIQTVCLRKPGSTRGKRLWHLPSILAYLKTSMKENGKLTYE